MLFPGIELCTAVNVNGEPEQTVTELGLLDAFVTGIPTDMDATVGLTAQKLAANVAA